MKKIEPLVPPARNARATLDLLCDGLGAVAALMSPQDFSMPLEYSRFAEALRGEWADSPTAPGALAALHELMDSRSTQLVGISRKHLTHLLCHLGYRALQLQSALNEQQRTARKRKGSKAVTAQRKDRSRNKNKARAA
jgi:hypothetical protein